MRGKPRSRGDAGTRGGVAALAFLFVLPLAAQQPGPPSTGGVAQLDFVLQHLAETRRVLVIGAHPDDEDTELITWAARHFGAEGAYLSLTRGDGGQNLIGDELGVALGLLRTRELEAARAVDGGHQFFTRAIDFGFTRSLTETERFWPPDSILKDVVRVIRRFRPHVIMTVFTGTPRDGHGQHQYSAVIGRRAYEAAGDPSIYPELLREEGLEPWTPLRLFRSAFFSRTDATLIMDGGVLDHRVGKTIHQIAMESRSQHRSQDFGVLQTIGPSPIRLILVHDRTGDPGQGLFDGVARDDTWLTRLADSLRESGSRPAAVLPALLGAMARLVPDAPQGHDMVEGLDPAVRRLGAAIAVAAGVLMDARADRPWYVAGDSVSTVIAMHNTGAQEIGVRTVGTSGPAGGHEIVTVGRGFSIASGASDSFDVSRRLSSGVGVSQPYFLRNPPSGASYAWPAGAALRGRPFEPPEARATVVFVIGHAWGLVEGEVTYRSRDQAVGEIRDAVRLRPRVGVALDPALILWPSPDTAVRRVTVTLTHFAGDTTRGTLRLEGDGWNLPPGRDVLLTEREQRVSVTFDVRRPPIARGSATLKAVLITAAGERLDQTVRIVSYPHIQPVQYLTPAEATVEVAPITLPRVTRLGYVRGAADHVPDVLARLGVPIVMLDSAMLARGDLAQFDAIVIGSRAYETDSGVVRHNDRLLAYARAGGHLIVQYQQYDFAAGGYAAYPFAISRPHDRITDETAPVTMLVPAHPVFTGPNRITDADWAGWPQERGLYFAGSWDGAYVPLLEMQDPGMPPMRGGLLVARYGEGTYTYTGISFFRAIPAGNAGALRLLLNLIDLKAADLVP